MPEPLKNLYTPTFIDAVAQQMQRQYAEFDSSGFVAFVFDEYWANRELKSRMGHIAQALHHSMALPYVDALNVLKPVSAQFSGFEYMFFPDFVARYGLEAYDASIDALEWFTRFSSSEFAVRPFIQRYPDAMMMQMVQWSHSANEHVRRLASEGCRPRLPWAMALPEFKQDPRPIVPILQNLHRDPSEYVRRSVANNLNDIAKDHPHIVIDMAKQWLGQRSETDKLVKHACRTLLKQGQPEVLNLFGFQDPAHIQVTDFDCQPQVVMGEALTFQGTLKTNQAALGKVRVEYAIDFVKKNGSQARKIFHLSESTIHRNEKSFIKHHLFKPISTRRYYAGQHELALIVNGVVMASLPFELVITTP